MKMMDYKKLLIFTLIFFLSMSGVFYWISNNLIYSLILMILSIITSLFICLVLFKKYEEEKIKYNECISFINKFIISMSINNSLLDSFESTKDIISEKLYLKLKEYDTVEEKLDYLEKYYNYKLFEIFNGILKEYLDKGGDIIQYSSTLLSEARRSQANINRIYQNSLKSLISFSMMWLFSFTIVIVARIALNDFYKFFVTSSSYVIILMLSFLFYLVSYVIYFKSLNFNKFMEIGKYEKVKQK